MNPQSPPPDMSTSYSWIGEDVRQAGIRRKLVNPRSLREIIKKHGVW